MLVLSRKENETIVIDGNIHITIVQCGRGKVKIGIQAPEHVPIQRSELVEVEEQPAGFLPSFGAANDLSTHYAVLSEV